MAKKAIEVYVSSERHIYQNRLTWMNERMDIVFFLPQLNFLDSGWKQAITAILEFLQLSSCFLNRGNLVEIRLEVDQIHIE